MFNLNEFSDEWLNNLHCILWFIREANIWDLHRVFYEASRRGLIRIDSWKWFGGKPRSPEIDAALALLELANVIVRDREIVKVVKPPLFNCKIIDGLEDTIKLIQ